MEGFLIGVLIVVLLVRWVQLRDRLNRMQEQMDALQRQLQWARKMGELGGAATHAPAPASPTVTTPPTVVIPPMVIPPMAPVPPMPVAAPVEPLVVPPPAVVPEPAAVVPPAPVEPQAPPAPSLPPVLPVPEPAFARADAEAPRPRPVRTSADWEALVGGNWLNKLGVFILVVGIALALGYSFTMMGPGGRVAVSVAVSLALLISGVVFERRERYRTFARGLLGGGWAALYFTVYAAQAIDADKVIDSPAAGALLLLAVAAGMVLHSLRYHSETVTGVAYFLAFVTLGITHVTALAVVALVPLAASILYLAHRFAWHKMAILGLVATYAVCALQHDSGAPLWQAQAIFTVYWLLFEGFDILHPSPFLLPLNAIGFLGLSLGKWHLAAPGREWQIVTAAGVAYLASTVIRARRSEWRWSVTLTGGLAVAAIFMELDRQWIAFALLMEAELYYLAGLQFGSRYLRSLGVLVFGLELGQMIAVDLPGLPYRAWTPIAALDAALFYINRALRPADVVFGYAGAAMMALVAGYEVQSDRGLAWFLLGAAPFVVGWWLRLADFRYQAYGLSAMALIGMVWNGHEPPLSLGICAALAYAGALAALWTAERFVEGEGRLVRLASSAMASGLVASLVWQVVPAEWRGIAWMGLALVMLEAGMRDLPGELRRQAYALGAAGAFLVMDLNLLNLQNSGPLGPRLMPVWAALAAYLMAARARKEEYGNVLTGATLFGTFFSMIAVWALLPAEAVGPAWAAMAVILVETGVPILRLEALVASAAVCARLGMANLDTADRLWTVAPVAASHYYLWWRTRWNVYLYTGSGLAAALIYFQASEVYRAPAWALLAVALLAAGRRMAIRDLCWQSYAVAAAAFGACWVWDFTPSSLLPAAVVVACLYGGQLMVESDVPRWGFLLGAASLAAGVLDYKVSGSMLTVAWGLEGISLLAAGFPLNDRNQRLSGLALLTFCIGKLFFYDLRHLETLPRIISFIALGLILVAVSWIYSRFRERVQKYL